MTSSGNLGFLRDEGVKTLEWEPERDGLEVAAAKLVNLRVGRARTE